MWQPLRQKTKYVEIRQAEQSALEKQQDIAYIDHK